jgi:hypothetical protein
MRDPLYVTPAGGLRLFDTAFRYAGILVVFVGGVLSLIVPEDGIAAVWITMALVLVTMGLIWLIVPRRYEVLPDRLRIVFRAFRWDVRYDTVRDARPAAKWMAYGYWGMRFATSPGNTVEVRRVSPRLFGRPNLIITPYDRVRGV